MSNLTLEKKREVRNTAINVAYQIEESKSNRSKESTITTESVLTSAKAIEKFINGEDNAE